MMEVNQGYIIALLSRVVASSAAFLLLCACVAICRGPTRHNTASLAPCTIGESERAKDNWAPEEKWIDR